MQFTFLDFAGKVLFVRDDAERAQWTTEELSLDLEFPYLSDKAISIGQRVFFIDPVGKHQIYEIKQAKTIQPDNYQQITAEHICISELSDCHMNDKEVTNKTCSSALSGILSGTGWAVGTKAVNPTSSADLSRGSVWQAVLQITDNWNVYIEPRVTLAADGTITRKLDIISTDGVWNGLRLSVNKNMLDPSVTYDDSEVATALYGYGGTIHPKDGKGEDTECLFTDVVWKKTTDHPAKPKGQNYIEDPAATKAYGRNGKARFGFFQNNDITDPNILLQKTWETLQTVNSPAISIEGTVADLYRLGYADQPIALHDIAIVEILPSGFNKQIQIIRMTVDLLDPSATTLTIGAYIPNIIYIQRQTDMDATGSRGGGGRNKSKETERHEFETAIESINAGTGLRFRAFQNDLDDMDAELKLQEARITINHDAIELEVTQRSKADGELKTDYTSKITQTATSIRSEVSNVQKGLQSQITQNADNISLVVKDGAVDRASIVASINTGGGSSVKITADQVDIDGDTVADWLYSENLNCQQLTVRGETTLDSVDASSIDISGTSILGDADCDSLDCSGTVSGNSLSATNGVSCGSLSSSGAISGGAISGSSLSVTGLVTASSGFKTDGKTATWQSYKARYCDTTASYTFTDNNGNNVTGRLVTSRTDTTIYYLGHT